MRNTILTASTLALLATGSVQAATMATATTDLNIRSGPGPQYEIVGVIDGKAEAEVEGCLETADWCRVSYDGTQGWSYGAYLAHIGEAETVAIVDESIEIATITYEDPASNDDEAAASAAVGALGGAIIAGPIGAFLGGIATGVAADIATPDERTITYVRENPVDPVYLEGEVVAGATFPDTVTIYEVPDTSYGYVYANGVTAVVDAETRTVVTVVR